MDNFKFKQQEISTGFYTALKSKLLLFNFSPFRVIPPTFVPLKNNFVAYTGVTNNAPATSKTLYFLFRYYLKNYFLFNFRTISI